MQKRIFANNQSDKEKTKRDSNMSEHCTKINRCNQRGGRMLSIIDLLEAESLPPDLAAYIIAAVNLKEASFMIGANPGGAGKTAVMGALLNLVPSSYELCPADSLITLEKAQHNNDYKPKCWICHEISSGPYYAYLWGKEAQAFFELSEQGHILATNLHADTYEQAYNQICQDNNVAEKYFNRMNLLIFLTVEQGFLSSPVRKVNTVYESTGAEKHRLIYNAQSSQPQNPVKNSQPSHRGVII